MTGVGQQWSSRRMVQATPERVIDTLTDPDACARWSPIPFSADLGADGHLRPGTRARVSGRLLGAPVRFCVDTLAADPEGLRLRVRGPVEIRADYRIERVRTGSAVEAHVSVGASDGPGGRLLARATRLLLAAGALDQAMDRITREAEQT